jgi:hypothetical protein
MRRQIVSAARNLQPRFESTVRYYPALPLVLRIIVRHYFISFRIASTLTVIDQTQSRWFGAITRLGSFVQCPLARYRAISCHARSSVPTCRENTAIFHTPYKFD